jgi:hypothetical protein
MRELMAVIVAGFLLATCGRACRERAEEMAARAERGDLRMAPR